MRRSVPPVAVAVAAVAVLAHPRVRRWLEIALIRTTGTTVRTQRRR